MSLAWALEKVRDRHLRYATSLVDAGVTSTPLGPDDEAMPKRRRRQYVASRVISMKGAEGGLVPAPPTGTC